MGGTLLFEDLKGGGVEYFSLIGMEGLDDGTLATSNNLSLKTISLSSLRGIFKAISYLCI